VTELVEVAGLDPRAAETGNASSGSEGTRDSQAGGAPLVT